MSLHGSCLIAAGLLMASPVCAKILQTKRAASAGWDPWVPLVVGSSIEFETDKEQSKYSFPLWLEYNFTQTLKLTVEPNFVHISPKIVDGSTITGVGDLETGLEYEFVRERRYRPTLTALGLIKWPTATNPDTGNPGRDYGVGLIASKKLVFVDVDISALYVFVGDPLEQDTLEISIAGRWPLNHFFDIEGEVVHSFGTGQIRGRPGSISGIETPGRAGGEMTEGTLGVAWHISKRLKIEQGGILRSDGTWRIVLAWEWSFSGD
jgi:hypothetical protein